MRPIFSSILLLAVLTHPARADVTPELALQKISKRLQKDLECSKPIDRRRAKVRDLAPWCGVTATPTSAYRPPRDRIYYLGLQATLSDNGQLADQLHESHLNCFLIADERGLCSVLSHVHRERAGEDGAFDHAREDVGAALLGRGSVIRLLPPYSEFLRGWARNPKLSPVHIVDSVGVWHDDFHIIAVELPGRGQGYVQYVYSNGRMDICLIPRTRVTGVGED